MLDLQSIALSLGFKNLDQFLIFLLFILLFTGYGVGKMDNFLVFLLFILLFTGPSLFK